MSTDLCPICHSPMTKIPDNRTWNKFRLHCPTCHLENFRRLFWTKVDKSSGCWIWKGSLTKMRYGEVAVRNLPFGPTPALAHRIAWILTNGPIPDNLHVLHKCDTPACVNPDHLFLGTHYDNMQDMITKGRDRKATGDRSPSKLYPELYRGERRHTAKLREMEVLDILESFFLAKESRSEIAERYPTVQKAVISAIIAGRSWRHVFREFSKQHKIVRNQTSPLSNEGD